MKNAYIYMLLYPFNIKTILCTKFEFNTVKFCLLNIALMLDICIKLCI